MFAIFKATLQLAGACQRQPAQAIPVAVIVECFFQSRLDYPQLDASEAWSGGLRSMSGPETVRQRKRPESNDLDTFRTLPGLPVKASSRQHELLQRRCLGRSGQSNLAP